MRGVQGVLAVVWSFVKSVRTNSAGGLLAPKLCPPVLGGERAVVLYPQQATKTPKINQGVLVIAI